MEKSILKSLFILVVLASAGCAPGEVESISGLDSYTVTGGSFSQSDSSIVQGTGSITFTSSVPNFSSRSMALKASLDNITLGTVTAVMYSNSTVLPSSSGVRVKFIRTGASVSMQISVNGSTQNVTGGNTSFFFPTALDVVIDVHNVGTKTRVYVWRRDLTAYAPETADIDSNTDLSGSLPNAVGNGTLNGVILENATVTAAQVSTSKVLD
ncbi:hypothetical protein EZJ49_08900 [Bdellovibrio bacteriovorus]|uniref:hypothetical protein n=1 Tax=Bdellovibrio bacteriovorus TaxID=959 RepID=UPI0021CFAA30|nr:hypothetical protein [Bdellovibrio bacteriovorus]UXR63194.1 hypothetical protein EZJ49_08900 [Bdellovibrio bacteriovorus]